MSCKYAQTYPGCGNFTIIAVREIPKFAPKKAKVYSFAEKCLDPTPPHQQQPQDKFSEKCERIVKN